MYLKDFLNYTLVLSVLITSCVAEKPQATPSRTWEATPVIAEYYVAPGGDEYVPVFVLYSNGDVVIKKYNEDAYGSYSLYKVKLSADEICSTLLKIESFGFFEKTTREFEAPDITDLNWHYITIRAWKTQRIGVYGLFPEYDIDQYYALASTAAFLGNYDHPEKKKYIPDTIDLQISISKPWEGMAVANWGFAELYLADIVTKGDVSVRVTGNLARKLSLFLGEDWVSMVNENGVTYLVSGVPHVPLQIKKLSFENNDSFGFTTPFSYKSTPTTTLSCDQEQK